MWYRLLEWFGDMRERHALVREFNQASRLAFVEGLAPTLLEARITRGESEYRHEFSKFMGGGFRIKALTGHPLSRAEQMEIGKVVIDNEVLVRRLISMGWDTLEVHDSQGNYGLKWALKKYANIGGLLASNFNTQ
jgi:hypothetical protein